jgi:hypothetical protein
MVVGMLVVLLVLIRARHVRSLLALILMMPTLEL